MTALRQAREPLHVVLIANDLAFAWTWKLGLEDAGLEVLIADNGRGGLKLVASVLPDVVVLDLRLPDMPGYGVLARLKSREATSNIPVVLVSDDSSKNSMRLCRMLGAADHLAKSGCSPASLAQRLAAWAA